METKATQTEIYNLIILDESGSMDCVRTQTISGCNETINTIRAAQKKYAESQKHYISIYAFQSEGEKPSRYIIKNSGAGDVRHITVEDYDPDGCTPLNDAVGSTLSDLKMTVKKRENAIGSVTIITDGMENSSKQYNTADIARMIEQLKELGWSFNFIGANIDVENTASQYNIENTLEFRQDEEGMANMWATERESRMCYYSRVEDVCCDARSVSRTERFKEAAQSYFTNRERISPSKIDELKPDEIFVFGSNLQGAHRGGAAYAAVTKFGAIMGRGVGLQGQSYAIPTMHGGVNEIAPYVTDFIEFAKANQNLKFLVTRIGCGIAGFKDNEIAPLFKEAIDVENIYLPESFYKIIKG